MRRLHKDHRITRTPRRGPRTCIAWDRGAEVHLLETRREACLETPGEGRTSARAVSPMGGALRTVQACCVLALVAVALGTQQAPSPGSSADRRHTGDQHQWQTNDRRMVGRPPPRQMCQMTLQRERAEAASVSGRGRTAQARRGSALSTVLSWAIPSSTVYLSPSATAGLAVLPPVLLVYLLRSIHVVPFSLSPSPLPPSVSLSVCAKGCMRLCLSACPFVHMCYLEQVPSVGDPLWAQHQECALPLLGCRCCGAFSATQWVSNRPICYRTHWSDSVGCVY